MKLFCFTYAGGTTAFYDELKSRLAGQIEVIPLEYPGRATRKKEPFCKNITELAEDMLRQMETDLMSEKPYALMGYSMGSIVVFEILSILSRKPEIKISKPVHVFLAAHEPKTKREFSDRQGKNEEQLIRERMVLFGGIPEKLLHNETFWRIYMPMYRADFRMIWDYDFDAMKLREEIPATIFFSETDTPRKEMIAWEKYFIGKNHYHAFDGNHFFIRKHIDVIAKIITDTLS